MAQTAPLAPGYGGAIDLPHEAGSASGSSFIDGARDLADHVRGALSKAARPLALASAMVVAGGVTLVWPQIKAGIETSGVRLERTPLRQAVAARLRNYPPPPGAPSEERVLADAPFGVGAVTLAGRSELEFLRDIPLEGGKYVMIGGQRFHLQRVRKEDGTTIYYFIRPEGESWAFPAGTNESGAVARFDAAMQTMASSVSAPSSTVSSASDARQAGQSGVALASAQ